MKPGDLLKVRAARGGRVHVVRVVEKTVCDRVGPYVTFADQALCGLPKGCCSACRAGWIVLGVGEADAPVLHEERCWGRCQRCWKRARSRKELERG